MSHLFEKPKLTVESEDLALPEIRTGKAGEARLKDTSEEAEIHFSRMKREEQKS